MRRLSGSSHIVQMEMASSAYQDKQERSYTVSWMSPCFAVQCASRSRYLPAEACRSGVAAPGSSDGEVAAGQTPSGACSEGCSLTEEREEGDVPRCAQQLAVALAPIGSARPQKKEHVSSLPRPRSGLSPGPAD